MSFLYKSASRSMRLTSTSRMATRQFSAKPTLRASGSAGDYGSGKGDPKGENPQEQGRNPQVDKEHPGPPPPSSAQGGSSSSSTSSSSSSSSGGSPKIHNEQQPSQESEDVRKHNEDVEKRSDKSREDPHDHKVDPKYWKGHGDDKAE